MYKEVLRSIEGIGIFPSIALILFVGIFVTVVIYLYKRGESPYKDAARLPLESDDSIENQQ